MSHNNFKVKLYHFPHCVLRKDLKKYSVGLSAEKTEVVFPKQCNNCGDRDKCSGIWKSYAKRFGTKEFK